MKTIAQEQVDSWGLGKAFDVTAARLFKLADEAGVLLSVKVRKHPTKLRLFTPPKAKKAK